MLQDRLAALHLIMNLVARIFVVISELLNTNNPQIRNIIRGYHKPIMLAGGIGNIREMHLHKKTIAPDDYIIVLGGPALLIGLGGGAASSMHANNTRIDLDFASVQRANPEMQRRCQEVIDACWALGEENPMVSYYMMWAQVDYPMPFLS